MIEIRESSIPNAGLGVWSTDFIPKDTLITEYYGEHLSSSEYALFEVRSLDHFSNEKLSSLNALRPYLRTQDNVYVFGDSSSRDIAKCGQLINDSCNVLDFSKDPKNISIQELNEYRDNSISKASVYTSYVEGKLLCYATYDIPSNQELFQYYGEMYWCSYFAINTPKELNLNILDKALFRHVELKKILTESKI